jgi:Bacterial toxin 43
VALVGLALVANASHPLPPDQAPPPEQGVIGMSLMVAPAAIQAAPIAAPYYYHYADKLYQASQTPLGQAGGNAAEEVVEDCLDGCTPESAIGSAAQGAIFGEATRGSGPVPGVLSVSPNSKSTRALQNYYPKDPIEFVFDPSTNTFAVGKPKDYLGLGGSPHQQLATSIGADPDVVVGGMFSRGTDGRIITSEHSGHYWQNWTPEVRKQFVEFLENTTGLPVDH